MYRRFTKRWWKYDFIGSPRRIYYKTKHFIQRGRRGYDETSFWSGDYYLARIMSGILLDLSTNNHGCPNVDPYIIVEPSKDNNWIGEYDFDQWDEDLRYHGEILDHYFYIETDNTYYESKVVPTLEWVAKHFGSLWD